MTLQQSEVHDTVTVETYWHNLAFGFRETPMVCMVACHPSKHADAVENLRLDHTITCTKHSILDTKKTVSEKSTLGLGQ
jgi:hypothetical protein